jgi:hypothetical protein
VDRVTPDGLSWAPSHGVFLRRVMISAIATYVGLVLAGLVANFYVPLPMGWVLLVALILTAGFVLEDVMRWRSTRSDRWQIEAGQLIHEGPDGHAQIPLSEVDRVTTQFGSRVTVKLASGQRIAMRYLAYPAEIAAQIEAARGPGRR